MILFIILINFVFAQDKSCLLMQIDETLSNVISYDGEQLEVRKIDDLSLQKSPNISGVGVSKMYLDNSGFEATLFLVLNQFDE